MTQTASDRELIGQLVARFDDATNRLDTAGFRSLWARDAVWEIMEPRAMKAKGIDDIVTKWLGLLHHAEWFFRASFIGVIDVDGDKAFGRFPCVEMSMVAPPVDQAHSGYDNRAFYEDEYVRQNGEWLFAYRRYVYFYISDAPFPGKPVPHAPEVLSDKPSFT